jgi:hypothetical protein
VKVLFVGDWAPQQREVVLQLRREDLLVANLEGPLLDAAHGIPPIAKAGPHIFNTQAPVLGCPAVFSLANNHTMDFGAAGLDASINRLTNSGHKFFGAGIDVDQARRPVVINVGKFTIGMIACCEAQFGSATAANPGVAVAGPWVYEAIRGLRKSGARVVISVHRGVEDYPWPTPQQCEAYHSYIEAGAEVVHGHHAHVPQGVETYKNGLILYGLGNFAVDPDKWSGNRHAMWSLGAVVDFSSSPLTYKTIGFSLKAKSAGRPILIQEHDPLSDTASAYLQKCNTVLWDREALCSIWQEVAIQCYLDYGEAFLNVSTSQKCKATFLSNAAVRLKKLLGRSTHVEPSIVHNETLLLRHVMIECDSHREMLATAMGVLSGAIEDRRTSNSAQLLEWFRSETIKAD